MTEEERKFSPLHSKLSLTSSISICRQTESWPPSKGHLIHPSTETKVHTPVGVTSSSRPCDLHHPSVIFLPMESFNLCDYRRRNKIPGKPSPPFLLTWPGMVDLFVFHHISSRLSNTQKYRNNRMEWIWLMLKVLAKLKINLILENPVYSWKKSLN